LALGLKAAIGLSKLISMLCWNTCLKVKIISQQTLVHQRNFITNYRGVKCAVQELKMGDVSNFLGSSSFNPAWSPEHFDTFFIEIN